MAQHTVTLKKGLTVGQISHTRAVLRELSAGDVIAAMEESERLVMVPVAGGADPRLVHSNAQMGLNTLRRQIASIGEVQGPIERHQLELLSAEDLEILQMGVDAMDAALAAAILDRGRSDATGGDD